MKIIYSFNKTGFEREYWLDEFRRFNQGIDKIIPFDHGKYISPDKYKRAQLLDDLFFAKNSQLLRMYDDLKDLMHKEKPSALIADNCFPYHPDFLNSLDLFKILRTTDGPLSAFDRDVCYIPFYDHVFYHSPGFSTYQTFPELLSRFPSVTSDFLPLGNFSKFRPSNGRLGNVWERPIDLLFVGSLYANKMPKLAALKKEFGKRFKLYGVASYKQNLYFNAVHHSPFWLRKIKFEDYDNIYRNAKIGINIHNRGKYTVGSYRYFDLPAYGAAQISDGEELSRWFYTEDEIEDFNDENMLNKVSSLLTNEKRCREIAHNGNIKVQKEYQIETIYLKMFELIKQRI
jgi:hypothetical protein